ncbi:MAG: glycosyltransferase [Bacteroidales bacterium]|nr:glycosyltransferase [Bacteroidales bacterium]
MNPPVIIFAYNRAKHLQRLINSLLQNAESSETNVVIFADGAKNQGDKDVAAVYETIQNITGFKNVKSIFRDSNIGLAKNIISGVSAIFEEYDEAIVLEDDLVVTPYFLRYMKTALDYYKDTNAFSIAGYTPRITLPENYNYDTYPIMRNCSWGWGTWKNRWELVDWQTKDFDSFFADNTAVQKFNLAGNDLSTMLLKQVEGKINSWSIRFCYAGFKAAMPTIYPTRSFVINGGADGSGTNVGSTARYNTDIAEYKSNINFCNTMDCNDTILKSFCKTYNTSTIRSIINWVKRGKWLFKRHPK